MTETIGAPQAVLLRPRDPLVARDARPFTPDPGARAFSLPFPLPRTVAGTLRTHLGNTIQPPVDWDNPDDRARVSRTSILGPLLAARRSREPDPGWTAFVPAPSDVVPLKADGDRPPDFMGLRPWEPPGWPSAAGCTWPGEASGLRPLNVTSEGKPDNEAPAFW